VTEAVGMGEAISISVSVIVIAIVVVGEGMVAVVVGVVVMIIHIVIIPMVVVVADELVYRLRCFIASVFIRRSGEGRNGHTDSKSLAHVLCFTAYFARIEWLRTEAVELGG
jgi:hypothetical protein